jgi:hypothetical protein
MVSCKGTPYGMCLFYFKGGLKMEDMKQTIKTIYSCMRVLTKQSLYHGQREDYLNKYVPTIPLRLLIMLWQNEVNRVTKSKMEVLIARKLISMSFIIDNNPEILERVLPIIERMSDIEAISILMESKNDQIFNIVYPKYCDSFEEKLDEDERLVRVHIIKEYE